MPTYDPSIAPDQAFQAEWILSLGAAVLCGALIGLDREIKARPAGLRTHALVSMAAAAFTIIGGALFARIYAYPDVTEPDFLRILEAVIAGVGFLGAGTIIRDHEGVTGITTGAGIWAAGAAGLACGAQMYGFAALVTALAIALLTLVAIIERHLPNAKKSTADDAGR